MLFGLWKEGRNKEQSQCCSLLSLDKMKIPVSLSTHRKACFHPELTELWQEREVCMIKTLYYYFKCPNFARN
jgi:hypothetical protein